MLEPEPLAEPAESADHVVADQQDTVFAADRLDPRPIALGRDDHAAGALHRLADEGRDLLRADLEDLLLHRVGRRFAEGARILPEPLVERIRLADPLDTGQPRPALGVHRLHPAQAGARDRRTVIGIFAGDDDRALRRSEEHPSELQSLMRISYAVLCLNKKKIEKL